MPCKYCMSTLPLGVWICEPCFTGRGYYPGEKLGERRDYNDLTVAIRRIFDRGWQSGTAILMPKLAGNGIVIEKNCFVETEIKIMHDENERRDKAWRDEYVKALSESIEKQKESIGTDLTLEGSSYPQKAHPADAASMGDFDGNDDCSRTSKGEDQSLDWYDRLAVTDNQDANLSQCELPQYYDHPYIDEDASYFNQPSGDHLTTSHNKSESDDWKAFEQSGHRGACHNS